MKFSISATSMAVAVNCAAVLAPVPLAAQEYSCESFKYREEAQVALEAGIDGLDGDGSGIACPDLPTLRAEGADVVMIDEGTPDGIGEEVSPKTTESAYVGSILPNPEEDREGPAEESPFEEGISLGEFMSERSRLLGGAGLATIRD